VPGLPDVAASLVAAGRGILAADESIVTMSMRLEGVGIAARPESRRDYRELLLTTPGLSTWISGVILNDETVHQTMRDGTPFIDAAVAMGIAVGVKVDAGVTPLPFADGGTVTVGLDGLGERLTHYRELGATFAKWRAVLVPSGMDRRTIVANAHVLARYAAQCQEAGVVPIIEPEVIMDGGHSAALCQAITANSLRAVFEELDRMGADPSALIVKSNMVTQGSLVGAPQDADDVARRTIRTLRETVPADVPGVAFLSGGQSNARACRNLMAINRVGRAQNVPWPLTFSFGRALVDDALHAWRGDRARVAQAQSALAANCARAADAMALSATAHPADADSAVA
jgi:fructose-bisphosphate aldolase class I